MKTNSSFARHWVTASSFTAAALLLGTLRADRAEEDASGTDPATTLSLTTLPPAIVLAEALYESRQSAIEWQLAEVRAESILLATPEARREAVTGWMRENRAVLESQSQDSEALDSLYVQSQVAPSSSLRALITADVARTADASSPTRPASSRLIDLLDLRARCGDDPEARRAALVRWSALDAEAAVDISVGVVDATEPGEDPVAADWPADAPGTAEPATFAPDEDAAVAAAPLSVARGSLLAADEDQHRRIAAIPRPRSGDFATSVEADAAVEARRQAATALPMVTPFELAPLRETAAAEAAARFHAARSPSRSTSPTAESPQ